MLNQLEDLAASLGMAFSFGTLADLEADAKHQVEDGYLLYHEGFFSADLKQDGQGALEYRHQLKLDICRKSKLTDSPQERRVHLLGLEIEMRRVYHALTKLGEVLQARAIMGLSITSTSLDYVQLSVTLLPPAVSLCNL